MAGEASSLYYQAARFGTKQAAGIVYSKVQELIYKDVKCDLSAYRLRLNNVWHVIVIGSKPADALHGKIEAQMTKGTLVTLEKGVLRFLLRRRSQAIKLGPWVEGHYSYKDEEHHGDK